jgi:hypothetical protein
LPHKIATTLLFVFVLLISGCTNVTPTPEPTLTPDLAETELVKAVQATQAAATAIVRQTLDVRDTQVAGTATEIVIVEATSNAKATSLANRSATRQAGTSTAVAEKTAVAQVLSDRLEVLVQDGSLTSTKGTYLQLEDFDESWAQINWYQFWTTLLSPEDFVIRTDAEWDSASNIANWFSSGCGFVYAVKDEHNHHATFLALDGYVRTYRERYGDYTELTSGWYGQLDVPAGKAEIMLAVQDGLMSFYVNGSRVIRIYDSSMSKGNLGLTLNSGTNKDWGTRCIMRNIEVWMLE